MDSSSRLSFKSQSTPIHKSRAKERAQKHERCHHHIPILMCITTFDSLLYLHLPSVGPY